MRKTLIFLFFASALILNAGQQLHCVEVAGGKQTNNTGYDEVAAWTNTFGVPVYLHRIKVWMRPLAGVTYLGCNTWVEHNGSVGDAWLSRKTALAPFGPLPVEDEQNFGQDYWTILPGDSVNLYAFSQGGTSLFTCLIWVTEQP